MQEIKLIFHNILEGDEPHESGVYLVAMRPLDVEMSLMQYYWDKEKHAWRFSDMSEKLIMPDRYGHYLWCEAEPIRGLWNDEM